MTQKVKIFCLPDGTPVGATFSTTNQAEGPDYGRRVKHNIYRDREDPRLWWHERVWLSRRRYTKPTCLMFVSKRKFFGKVRLVMYRDGCLADTWRTIADSITVMESKGRKKQ